MKIVKRNWLFFIVLLVLCVFLFFFIVFNFATSIHDSVSSQKNIIKKLYISTQKIMLTKQPTIVESLKLKSNGSIYKLIEILFEVGSINGSHLVYLLKNYDFFDTSKTNFTCPCWKGNDNTIKTNYSYALFKDLMKYILQLSTSITKYLRLHYYVIKY